MHLPLTDIISKKAVLLTSLATFLFVSVFASMVSAMESEGSPKALFTFTAAPVKEADAGFVRDKEVVRSHLAEIHLDLLTSAADLPADSLDTSLASIRLNLFEDVGFIADLTHCERTPGGVVWIGRLRGVDFSQVVIVVNGGIVSGNITMPKARYHIRYTGGGVHEIEEVDQARFPKDHPFDAPLLPPRQDYSASDPGPQPDACGQIDVMVIYSATTRIAAGGTSAMQSLINLAVAETNQSYANAGVTQRLRLVYAGEVAYAETGDLGDALDCVTHADGCLDNVATLRDTYGADLVSFWVENGGSACGIGWLMANVSSSFAPYGFSAVARSCATGYYSFGHELGHNMGARHDLFMDTSASPYSYAHGYVHASIAAPWRTIMAYNDACSAVGLSCNRLQYWSNPSKSYGGVAMGDATADNRSTLNNTACTVANFRTATATYSLSGTVHSGSATGPVLAGAVVSIAGKTATTSAAGTFSIAGITAGSYTLTVSKTGYQTYTKASYVVSGNQSNLTFYITTFVYNMSGTLRSGSATGPILAGAVVSIAGKTATTNSYGTFSIPGVPAGSYTLVISKSGYQTCTRSGYAVSGNQTGLVFPLMPLCNMGGTVRSGSATGAVLAGAVVSIAGKSAITSSYGTFSITAVPAGSYTLTISKAGYQSYTKSGYVISGNQSNLVFPLLPLFSMSGTVRSGSTTGPVLAGATVTIAGKTVTTSSYGTFSIAAIPAGSYTLTISRTGYLNKTYSGYALTANKTGLVFYLSVTPKYSMSGTVRQGSATGPGLAGATVAVAGKTAVTTSTGTFSITQIPAGTYALTISKSGFLTKTNAAYAVNGNQSGLVFFVSPSTTGAVKTINGSSYSITELYVSPSSYPYWGPNQLPNMIPAGGSLTLIGVPPNTYDLMAVFSNGSTYTKASFKVSAGMTSTITAAPGGAGALTIRATVEEENRQAYRTGSGGTHK